MATVNVAGTYTVVPAFSPTTVLVLGSYTVNAPALATTDVTGTYTVFAAATIAANAGPDQAVDGLDTVTLSGTASTGTPTGYLWAQTAGTPTVTLTGASTATATFKAPGLAAGATLTFSLTVTKPGLSDHTDTVVVTVYQHIEFQDVAGAWVPVRTVLL